MNHTHRFNLSRAPIEDDGAALRDTVRRALGLVAAGLLAMMLFGAGITIYVALTGEAAAEPGIYVGGTVGRATSPAPAFQNTELIAAQETQGNSEALVFGYRFASGIFIEASPHKLPDGRSSYFSWSGGTGVTSIYQENVTQNTDALSLLVGLPFARLGNAEVSALIGGHYYKQRTYRFSRLEQYEEALGNEIVDRVLRENRVDTGVALSAGVGASVPLSRRVNLIGRATRFGKIKQSVLEFGVAMSF